MKKIALIASIIFFGNSISNLNAQSKKLGQLSGSIESNSARYFINKNADSFDKPDKFATNNYIKLDYRIRNFSSGIQFEAYTPPLAGYSTKLNGAKITQAFLNYNTKTTEITLGSFYEQFGSGIAYRSFEDRSLGMNNSTLGASINIRPHGSTKIKAFVGKPRNYMNYSSTIISGIDGEVSIFDILTTKKNRETTIGASFTNQQNRKIENLNYPTSIQTFSERASLLINNFTLSIENTHRSNAQIYSPNDGFFTKQGTAFLINSGYNSKGFGVTINFRRVENMQTRIENTITDEPIFMNYIPALTKIHKYSLPNLHPYNVQANNEIGFQLDINYEFKNAILGGNNTEKVSINYAKYNNLFLNQNNSYSIIKFGKTQYFSDLSLEIEKRWNKKLKSNAMFVAQSIDRLISDGMGTGVVKTKVVINEILYKVSAKSSIRNELQYAWTTGKDGNLIFALIEYGYAPGWLFYASDMYNFGGLKAIHYYNFGCSFTKNAIRSSLSLSRNRAGYQCSGGICRFVPEFEGVSFTITASF